MYNMYRYGLLNKQIIHICISLILRRPIPEPDAYNLVPNPPDGNPEGTAACSVAGRDLRSL